MSLRRGLGVIIGRYFGRTNASVASGCREPLELVRRCEGVLPKYEDSVCRGRGDETFLRRWT